MHDKLTVKGARQLAGYTQTQMAAKMGVHMQTYRKLEQYPGKMTIEQARRFCSIVHRSVEDIFFDSNSSLTREYTEN